MREREITLLLQYILNNKHILEEELRELEQRSRYRKTTILDHLEIILLKQRIEEFNRVTRDIYHLLGLEKYKFDDEGRA